MRDMTTPGIEQIFTSYDNPKGNVESRGFCGKFATNCGR